MLFNSLDFAVFLPLVFFAYWAIPGSRIRWQNALLLAASYVFYGWWDWRFLALLAGSSAVDYLVGRALGRTQDPGRRRVWLGLSLLVNLGVLFTFKYFGFFADAFASAFTFLGYRPGGSTLSIVLPVGISFYTFQTLSYTIDVYRRTLPPARDAVAFFAFVGFFPQLVAGPIERAGQLLPQFGHRRVFSYADGLLGVQLFCWGLFKKVVVADSCGRIVDLVFADYSDYSGSTLLLGAVLFSFQIYGDFSGYSDMALGTARLFGFRLQTNFAYPYFARDIGEFWRRWHISLTRWFRDYLYIPLGGSRMGLRITVRNVFVVFLVSGLWHGANWTFIVWGLIHFVLYLPLLLRGRNRRFLGPAAPGRWWPGPVDTIRMGLAFGAVTLAWVVFRSPTLGAAAAYLTRIFTTDPFAVPYVYGVGKVQAALCLLSVGALLLTEWLGREGDYPLLPVRSCRPRIAWAVCFLLAVAVLLLGQQEQAFIYFQF
ncbi:MBOAT family O-acyltransferase [Lewinella sp. IMCC34183]|uniref:MBOAT family O-acyltransferase n=1 Tax=Lewinella sp. IMCC34183 TaxID=2248762 RepID=UPI000E22A152|nr:MBOAT family O-acyltransferase [Lewinella sp. IMCC34183]